MKRAGLVANELGRLNRVTRAQAVREAGKLSGSLCLIRILIHAGI